ncbi:MAG: tetratricopeptide repeat protein [Microcoleus sp.]
MAVQLTKGERFNLSQTVPDLKKVAIALGWQLKDAGENFEIDASAFMLGADGKIPNDNYFVFYNNLRSPDSSVLQSVPQPQPDRENKSLFGIILDKIDPAIQEIVFVVTLHEAEKFNLNFSQLDKAFIKLSNLDGGSEIARYELKHNFSQETALDFGRLYRKNGAWKFQAVGQGYLDGLHSFIDKYSRKNSNNTGVDRELAIASAGNLQLSADELEMESAAASSSEIESRQPSIANNRVNFGIRKIPLALGASLGLLVLGMVGGSIALMHSANQTMKQAKLLIVETPKAAKETDVNLLRSFDKRLQETIANLERIPNLPGFGYQQSRADLTVLRNSSIPLQQNLQAAEMLETAQKLAVEAATIVQKPPHPVEVWYRSKSKWQESIGLLESIGKNTPVYNLAQKKLSNYRQNFAVISQRLAIAQKAANFSNQGSLKVQKGDSRGAIAYFHQALGLNANIPQAYLGLGIANLQQGNKQQAINNYDRALQLNPNLAEAYFGRGQAYYQSGNKQRAITDYEQAIRVNPNYGLAYLERGAVRCMSGIKSEAVADFQQASELFSKQGDTNNYQFAQRFIADCQQPTTAPVLCNYARNIDSLGRPCGKNLSVKITVKKNSASVPANSEYTDINLNKNAGDRTISTDDSSDTSTSSRRRRRSRR